MKNVVFRDIEEQFVPHRRYVSATEPSRLMLYQICGFAAVAIKNAVFWDVTQYDSCMD
jgi:hypothetical protein